ncbi:MAG TPA: amidohydrolase family protein [Flavitalea sp.]|nr:amidohydrolase family protein [Flavitalea sp.]
MKKITPNKASLNLIILLSLLSVLGGNRITRDLPAKNENVFDIHVHLWDGNKSYDEYISQLDSTGMHVTKFGGILIARRGESDRTRKKNNELIELSKRYPKLVPICSVHPLDGDTAIQELKRLADLKVKMIKLHPHTQNFDVKDDRVADLCQLAGKLGIIVLMDNANIKPGDSENLFDLAVKCPKTKFIFAHMGALNFRFWNILPLARTAKGFFMDNIYFDISATLVLIADSPLEEEFIWTIRNVGVKNVLLGSDYPQFTLKQATEALKRLDLESDEKDKIQYTNAVNLLFPQHDVRQ